MFGPSAEDELIVRHFAPLAGEGGLGLVDDAARFAAPAGCDIVATVDALVGGVHFFDEDAAASVARKALRVNLSDLAAKAAEPLGFLLTLALPAEFREDRIAAFAAALGEDSRLFGCQLLGGDTVATPGPLTISITVLGTVPHGCMIPRAGAAPGDRLYVTGTIGDAALGLRLRRDRGQEVRLAAEARAFLLDRYLHPQPRLGLRAALRNAAHAAMDVSDGFAGDLSKMLRASGLSGLVELWRAPLSDAGKDMIGDNPELLDVALTGGDDYEILAAVPPELAEAFEADAAAAGIVVTWVGNAFQGAGAPIFEDASGKAHCFAQTSFSHF